MSGFRAARRLTCLAGSLLLGCAGPDALAQSDEPWLMRAALPAGTRPLLALILDTSAAMAEPLAARAPYDPARDYAGGAAARCDPRRVYWRRGPGPVPDCDDAVSVPLGSAAADAGFHCEAGRRALASTGVYVASRAAQWSPHPAGGYWHELREAHAGAVECRADRGVHGAASGVWFASQGPAGPWSRDDGAEPLWDAAPLGDSYVFLSGNYLNYLAQPDDAIAPDLYAWTVSSIAVAAASVDGLDLAVLRLSHDGLPGDDAGRGGMVAIAPAALPAAAPQIARVTGAWIPSGPAPLAEALVEAAAWLTGGPLVFGEDSHAAPGQPLPSTPDVRDPRQPGLYVSPFTSACRPVTLGMVTAGRPSADASAGQAAQRLSGFPDAAAGCGDGCLATLAGWLGRTDLLPELPGRQHAPLIVATLRAPAPEVREAARAAGTPLLELADPLAVVMMAAHALQHDAAVASGPRLSAAAVDVAPQPAGSAAYYGLSAPAAAARWPGNLRRFALRPTADPLTAPAVVGRDGEPAFDGSGLALRPESWSVWSDRPDGADIRRGGGAAALPEPRSRVLYADLASAVLTEPGNRIEPSNPALTRDVLGLVPGDPRSVAQLAAWALGADAFDADDDGDLGEPRRELGDPGLWPPRIVRYGGAGGPALVFVATNDGALHAFDTADGTERWSFVPRPLLRRLAALALPTATVARRHGLDGSLTVQLVDTDGDGRVAAAGDRAWLFVALGRGGAGYYALDVTDPAAPRVLWSLTGPAAAALGDGWPAPVVARMRLDDRRQSTHRLVAVLAGGHDPAQSAWPRPADARGARLLILDAERGEVLWRASGPGDDQADLVVAGLTASLPSAPRVIDTDGDGFADRMYLLGIGGRLWRIDFTPGAEPAGLAAASLLGAFGDADQPGDPPRRFYSTPDVSHDANGGRPRFIVAFGSGWLARPRDARTEDRFYAIFDPVAGAPAAGPALRDADLSEVTGPPYTAAPDARGWMLRLALHGRGEKTTGTSLTFDHRLRFTTYQPLPAPPDEPCGPPAGLGRLYTLDVRSGRPVNWIGDQPVPAQELAVQGLLPGVRVVFPPPSPAGACVSGCSGDPFALLGGRALDLEFRNDPVKTTWRRLVPAAE